MPIFSKKQPLINHLGDIGLDFHSHLIPGIDDGAKSMDQSLEMLQGLQELGYHTVITTPHIHKSYYFNTAEGIQEGARGVREAMAEKDIHLEFRAAAEYFLDDHFLELLEQKALLTLDGKRVLIEMSFRVEYMGLREVLFQMQARGYQPVLAHPERYRYFWKSPHVFEDLKSRGCELQLNMGSLFGFYSPEAQNTAEKLLNQQLYDFIGTDLHYHGQLQKIQAHLPHPLVQKALQYEWKNETLTTD